MLLSHHATSVPCSPMLQLQDIPSSPGEEGHQVELQTLVENSQLKMYGRVTAFIEAKIKCQSLLLFYNFKVMLLPITKRYCNM